MAINLGKHRLTRHRSALPANSTSSRPRSWSLGNATLVVAERSGWRRVLGASKRRPSARGAHRYRNRACLEALRLATTKLTQRGTGYPSSGHPAQLRISRGSTRLIHKWQNWTLTALQRRRIEAAEMKLLRPLTGYTLYDHKTNDCMRCGLRITGILDKIDEYRRNWLSHLQRMP